MGVLNSIGRVGAGGYCALAALGVNDNHELGAGGADFLNLAGRFEKNALGIRVVLIQPKARFPHCHPWTTLIVR
jgi:hypothetical protein